ncbi:VWA-like domain-containing protein [uncultured Thiodictyon sp.]|uniref:vWA domain-containing protein n=1 Tax=uncultured Thiodictyon sp. TaxID=1846217 RepID=UPI0025E62CF0|nr:VWA-like domain-containing protein [uncultured Thiodictyon sp.]
MNPIYTHRGTRAIQRMVEYAPSSGGLALWIDHRDLPDAPTALTAANDGSTIFYGPGFESLSLPQQAGLVAHEVLHVALRHRPRYVTLRGLLGDVDLPLFNCCADAIVNSALGHLSWLELPRSAVTLEGVLRHALKLDLSTEQALLDWDLERLYRAIDDRGPSLPSAGRRGSGSRQAESPDAAAERAGETENLGASDGAWRPDGPRSAQVRRLAGDLRDDLWPGPDEDRPENAPEQAREWGERLLRAHTGDGAFSLLRTLLADLPRLRTPWEHLLRTHLTRGLSLQPGLSWSRPSRSYQANKGRVGTHGRLPWEPGHAAARTVARLVVMVDCSGSIEDQLLDRFAQEVEAASRRLEARIVVIVGDDRVTGVATFEPGRSNLRELVFNGGGGTDFSPLLREADRHRPDLGLFLTDLQGPADWHPTWPVIWAVPVAYQDAVVPFGRKLVLG